MESSNPGVTDDSATISDDDETIETDVDLKDAVDSPPSPGSRPFSEGEKVLAYHSHQLYGAKVQKVEWKLKEWRYWVHYLGWNKNWDEWVSMDRLKKFTPENVKKQEELKAKQKYSETGRVSQIKTRNSTVARGKKRKNGSITKEKGHVSTDKLVDIHIPTTLRKHLVDDCEFITHLGKLIKLPRNPNVDDILAKYLDYRLKKDSSVAEPDSVAEILKGLRCYFDKALGVMLLYNTERQQYKEAIANDISPSTVYGAEHLLRLFVKLPEILNCAHIEEDTLKELQQKLVEFLKFLQKNESAFFLSTYQTLEGV